MTRGAFNAGRRAFLSGVHRTPEGRQRDVQLQRPLGPALPWLAEEVAARFCLRCDAPCMTACPAGIIELHGPRHSLEGRPYLSFRKAGCNYCGECAQACPHVTEPSAGRPELGAVVLDSQTCLAWNGVVCISCLSRCPQRALHRDGGGRVMLNADACNGCGMCVSVCPVEAIAVYPSAGAGAA